jgi:hypothetical protein
MFLTVSQRNLFPFALLLAYRHRRETKEDLRSHDISPTLVIGFLASPLLIPDVYSIS